MHRCSVLLRVCVQSHQERRYDASARVMKTHFDPKLETKDEPRRAAERLLCDVPHPFDPVLIRVHASARTDGEFKHVVVGGFVFLWQPIDSSAQHHCVNIRVSLFTRNCVISDFANLTNLVQSNLSYHQRKVRNIFIDTVVEVRGSGRDKDSFVLLPMVPVQIHVQ